jgi:hypothetical protein
MAAVAAILDGDALVFDRLLPLVTPHLPQKICNSHSYETLSRGNKKFMEARPDILCENIMPQTLPSDVGDIKIFEMDHEIFGI